MDATQKLTFIPVSIVLSGTGKDVFTYIADIDDDYYIMRHPLAISRQASVDNSGLLMYDKLNPFTDDIFTGIHKSEIQTINTMSKSMHDKYVTMLKQLSNMEEQSKVDQTKQEDESFNDIDSYVFDDSDTIH